MKRWSRAGRSEPPCSSPDGGDTTALASDTGGTVLVPSQPGIIYATSTVPASLALGPPHGNLAVERTERCMSLVRTKGQSFGSGLTTHDCTHADDETPSPDSRHRTRRRRSAARRVAPHGTRRSPSGGAAVQPLDDRAIARRVAGTKPRSRRARGPALDRAELRCRARSSGAASPGSRGMDEHDDLVVAVTPLIDVLNVRSWRSESTSSDR